MTLSKAPKVRIVKKDSRNLVIERFRVNKETGETSWVETGNYYSRLSQAWKDVLPLVAETALSKYPEDGEVVTGKLIKEAVDSIVAATVQYIESFQGTDVIAESKKDPTAKKRGRPKKNGA